MLISQVKGKEKSSLLNNVINEFTYTHTWGANIWKLPEL